MDGSITVFGGTGFIGRHLVPLLVRSGATVRIAVRDRPRVQVPKSPTKQRYTSKPICLTTSLSALQSREPVQSSTSWVSLLRRLTKPIGPFTSKPPVAWRRQRGVMA
jgi:short subunit dehydrogenase-like uncharacterized protein